MTPDTWRNPPRDEMVAVPATPPIVFPAMILFASAVANSAVIVLGGTYHAGIDLVGFALPVICRVAV